MNTGARYSPAVENAPTAGTVLPQKSYTRSEVTPMNVPLPHAGSVSYSVPGDFGPLTDSLRRDPSGAMKDPPLAAENPQEVLCDRSREFWLKYYKHQFIRMQITVLHASLLLRCGRPVGLLLTIIVNF